MDGFLAFCCVAFNVTDPLKIYIGEDNMMTPILMNKWFKYNPYQCKAQA